MKKFISFFLAATIVGFICFALTYWVFSLNKSSALNIAIAAAVSGFVVEYFKPVILRLFKNL